MTERLTRAQQQERTRERLLDAAEKLFGERGIHATSLDAVAAEAGLTKGAIYANFAGKQALITAILERRVAGSEGDTPAESLAVLVERSGEEYKAELARPEVSRCALACMVFFLYGLRDEQAHTTFKESLRHMRSLYQKDFEKVGGDDLPLPMDQLAVLMLALDVGVSMQHLLDPEGVPADIYGEGIRMLLGRRDE